MHHLGQLIEDPAVRAQDATEDDHVASEGMSLDDGSRIGPHSELLQVVDPGFEPFAEHLQPATADPGEITDEGCRVGEGFGLGRDDLMAGQLGGEQVRLVNRD